MMKSILLAGAAIVVCALPHSASAADLPLKAAPVVSVPQATGYVEVYGGWASTKIDESGVLSGESTSSFHDSASFKGSVLGGAARGNYWLTPTFSMQLDVQAEGTSYNYASSSIGTASSLDYLIGGHVNWRDSNRGLVGAFAGIGDVNSTRHAVFGAEGQYYANQYTLYLQGGYDTTLHSVFGVFDFDAWFIRGTGRYYLTPNLRLEATGMYADGTINPSALSCSSCFFNWTFSTLLWEAKAEWKLDNSPFALFFKYRGSETDTKLSAGGGSSIFSSGSLDAKTTDNRFLVGARMYLGEKSLLWNDRQGATLDIITPLAAQSGLLYPGGGPSIGPSSSPP
jgi:hypothetical protein